MSNELLSILVLVAIFLVAAVLRSPSGAGIGQPHFESRR
jgi:hypothetical protein